MFPWNARCMQNRCQNVFSFFFSMHLFPHFQFNWWDGIEWKKKIFCTLNKRVHIFFNDFIINLYSRALYNQLSALIYHGSYWTHVFIRMCIENRKKRRFTFNELFICFSIDLFLLNTINHVRLENERIAPETESESNVEWNWLNICDGMLQNVTNYVYVLEFLEFAF